MAQEPPSSPPPDDGAAALAARAVNEDRLRLQGSAETVASMVDGALPDGVHFLVILCRNTVVGSVIASCSTLRGKERQDLLMYVHDQLKTENLREESST